MKRRDEYWKFIKDNLSSLLTITSGIILTIFRLVGIIKDAEIIVAILGLVTLLATTDLLDKSRKLDRIEDTVKTSFNQVISTLKGVEVYAFSDSSSAFEFMAENILSAESSIDHVALAPSVPRWHGQHKKYTDAITKVLKGNKIRYRYMARLPEQYRLERIVNHLTDPSIRQYFVKHFPDSNELLFHNFMVFDNKTVIVNYPYEPGEPEKFVAIRHPDIVGFYSTMFSTLWKSAKLLDKDIAREMLNKIGSKNKNE